MQEIVPRARRKASMVGQKAKAKAKAKMTKAKVAKEATKVGTGNDPQPSLPKTERLRKALAKERGRQSRRSFWGAFGTETANASAARIATTLMTPKPSNDCLHRKAKVLQPHRRRQQSSRPLRSRQLKQKGPLQQWS